MRTTGWITRVSCVVSLLWGSLVFAQATAPGSKTNAAAPPPKTSGSTQKSQHKSTSAKHKVHTPSVTKLPCADQGATGRPADFEPAACPASCNVGKPQPRQDLFIDVDDYIDHGKDDDTVCLRAGDTITYKSSSRKNFKIKDIQSKPRHQAHPFMGGLKTSYDSKPYGSGPTQTDKLEIRNSAVPDNGCYVFRPHVEVDKGNGTYECHDPHIYTDCGDACDAFVPLVGSLKVTPPSKDVVARKQKTSKSNAEVPAPGGR